MVIGDDLKMGDMSCEDCFMKNLTLSQQDFDSSNGDISSRYGFINSQTLSKCKDSITFKDMDGDVGKGGVSSGCEFMNSHTDLQ